jgi:transcriptional regulator with XRE-family HTH domain
MGKARGGKAISRHQICDICAFVAGFFPLIGDNGAMAKRVQTKQQKTGLYYAREARGMSRTKLVDLSGVSKQQLSRLENGMIRLRLDHLKPFAKHLGYTPEQMLLWGKLPGTGEAEIELGEARRKQALLEMVPELDLGAEARDSAKSARKGSRRTDSVKPDPWVFPSTFVHEQLHSAADRLVVMEIGGDSMAPTVTSGDRVVIDTGRNTPSPDGLYAIRDPFEGIAIKRLQLLRSAKPPKVKVISDNPKHPAEEIALSEVEIVGKVVCCLKVS